MIGSRHFVGFAMERTDWMTIYRNCSCWNGKKNEVCILFERYLRNTGDLYGL